MESQGSRPVVHIQYVHMHAYAAVGVVAGDFFAAGGSTETTAGPNINLHRW